MLFEQQGYVSFPVFISSSYLLCKCLSVSSHVSDVKISTTYQSMSVSLHVFDVRVFLLTRERGL